MKSVRLQKGFTLIELAVVLALVLIIAGITVPSVQSALRGYQVNTLSSSVARMIQQARSVAINQGSNACVRLSGNFFGVDANCDGSLGTTEVAIFIPNGVSLTATGPGSTTGMDFSTAPTAVASPFVITFGNRGSTSVTPTTSVIYINGWTKYSAVTVTGIGRARSWRYNGAVWY